MENMPIIGNHHSHTEYLLLPALSRHDITEAIVPHYYFTNQQKTPHRLRRGAWGGSPSLKCEKEMGAFYSGPTTT
ncbi:unnamed protein product [marine sediment metagenome]|uniref:Uncharacterized protein n=1 Tax=marine sediment metagenome TaxID=412755 RepID=X1NCY2_9ZZZZ